MLTKELYGADETFALGQKLGANAKPGELYCLTGGLGAGKTVFAKGFARGLGINEDITSPTFTIINEYHGRLPLYHFDVYRIKSAFEMEDTGCDDYFYSNGVCVIEWAELIRALIPDSAVWINIEKELSKGDNYRLVRIGGYNDSAGG